MTRRRLLGFGAPLLGAAMLAARRSAPAGAGPRAQTFEVVLPEAEWRRRLGPLFPSATIRRRVTAGALAAAVALAALALARPAAAEGTAVATFAGGCFWCMEPPFDALEGVLSTTSGYMGGHTTNPTYRDVSAGGTGHAEVVQIAYDPGKVTYAALLDVFWRNVDPTTPDRQFCDVGSQYRSAIFVHDETQRRLAEASRAAIARRLGQPVVTEIAPASTFYPAEEYHQDYYRKNPLRYRFYRYSCGRDQRLESLWGKAKEAAAPAR